MKKQTKVLLAAAMLTLGASFTSMAALSNGTWVLNDEGWQYADKEGEYVDNEWCKSNGIEFWINDDEVLGSCEWVVEDLADNKTREFYVQSDGSKTISAWKYLYAIDDEDEEGDQNWYYFDAKGRMVKDTKKTIDGYDYYFNKDGKMVTGWVDSATKAATEDMTSAEKANVKLADLVYTNEDGQVVKTSWINVFPWTEDDGYEGEDEKWFYTTSAGKLNINKQVKVDGLSYIFDANGQMFTKWVGKNYAGNYVAINKDATVKVPTSVTFEEVYYCDADNGYVKKDGWRNLTEADGGSDKFWYHFDKLGRAFLATDANADKILASAQIFNNGEKNDIYTDSDATAVIVNSKKINGVEYFFNQKGEMIDGLQNIDGDLVYLEEGAKVTGKVTLTDENENDYTFYFGEKNDGIMKKYIAVDGVYKNYAYKQGQLITSDDKDSFETVTFGTKTYVVDHNGKVQHKDGKDYGLGMGELKFDAEGDFIITK